MYIILEVAHRTFANSFCCYSLFHALRGFQAARLCTHLSMTSTHSLLDVIRNTYYLMMTYCQSRIFRMHEISVCWGPFVRMKFLYSHFSLMRMKRSHCVRTFETFARKPPRTKYTKIKSIQNVLDLQQPPWCYNTPLNPNISTRRFLPRHPALLS